MFRKELETSLKKIFGVKKVSFDAPSESFEQDTLFVDLTGDPRVRVSKGKLATARVQGDLVIFAQMGKVPTGFFAKKIEQAAAELTKPFFFSQLDRHEHGSAARLQNIAEIRASFTYFYSAQYDPNQGSITGFGDGFSVSFAPTALEDDDETLLALEDGNAQE